MAKNWNMAEPTPNHILPAYVERGHVQVVFENEPETVEPSTPTATNSEGTNNAPDQPQTGAMAETATAMTEVEESQSKISTPPFRELVTEESPRLRNLANLCKLEDNFDFGYDSDGELGPFFDMEDVEGVQMFDEPVLGEEPPPETPEDNNENEVCEAEENNQPKGSNSGDNVAPPAPTGHVPIEEDELLKLNRDQLKHQLRIRGQKLSGNKSEMLERLQKALEEKLPVVGAKKKTGNKN